MARQQRKFLGEQAVGQFLRLAEFAAGASFDEVYARVGGTVAQRQSFLDHLLTSGYIELGGAGAMTLTSRGRRASRQLMKEADPVAATQR